MIEALDLTRLPGILLIFARLSGFFMMVPFFSYRSIPMNHRVAFVILLTWVMYFVVDIPVLIFDGFFVILLLKEITVGLFIGLLAYIILSAVQIAGGFIDFQMGFAIANIVDPQTGVQSPIIGQYFYIFTLLLLVATDAHHLLLDGIYYSYQFIEINELINISSESFPEFIMKTFGQMFAIAFQMSIPIVGMLFLVDIALGMIARTVPQVNVFVVGLPLKILVSFAVLLIFFSFFYVLITNLFDYMLVAMRDLMRILGGS
ncbi:flagellar biosynthetic protein FliR [Tenuibacillus multivorans]|uniref:Flagellar biosynthetic protein FliR n=1 Tax=Tenuibacillus multivorans TaxID=237069 RepID=A0A1G9XYK3_9BACI|nr:flagellar biosynthetic protein FliR [Tenuibacillus multivorans]GEL75863.1 flagellar biosynthetic protein FliR [Tenuibacillus multivorans]SDN01591.1 flagellar biosynthetic protein FliR [Tenuibacillus multivorans]